jgi:hypothetical protein
VTGAGPGQRPVPVGIFTGRSRDRYADDRSERKDSQYDDEDRMWCAPHQPVPLAGTGWWIHGPRPGMPIGTGTAPFTKLLVISGGPAAASPERMGSPPVWIAPVIHAHEYASNSPGSKAPIWGSVREPYMYYLAQGPGRMTFRSPPAMRRAFPPFAFMAHWYGRRRVPAQRRLLPESRPERPRTGRRHRLVRIRPVR